MFLIKRTCKINRSNNRRVLYREWGEVSKMDHICQLIIFLCLKGFLPSDLHPDVACIAGSRQHIGNPNSEASRCIGINLSSSPVPDLNRIVSKKVRFLTLWHKNVTATSVSDKLLLCSCENYRKGSRCTQTFFCQLVCGCK